MNGLFVLEYYLVVNGNEPEPSCSYMGEFYTNNVVQNSTGILT